ncbi:AcrR family transcriptional regulator [Rhodococcus erythropolis]|uniref:TetR/AcrR family transcriptional regulator n=1 Tax=Rhodococcus erythropolis TaxID=1833 RepID=UPI00216AA1C5|nr:TetR/AcrR family transcriptional regulator [Rhodococcus erythropolis]MCS4255996.1 AcrR family transcriptional regulator [Rhodococcus erythropolis]MCW2425512.1 AcrR family transcriptional regulator [Rhodococcus erythropolis]
MPVRNGTSVTRERILAAARPVVERFTVTKFGMEDVARAAGIARQTIYKHFTGRDDLLIAMFIQQLTEMREELSDIVEAEPSPEQLVAIFIEELKAAKDFPLFDAMLDPAVAPKMAEMVFSSDEMFAARNAAWFPILERYTASGVVDPGLDFARTVRWITYQEFWFLTHPTVLTPIDEERSTYVRDFIVKALLAR